ncbi:hypothetical protein [Mesorhizobium sp. LCM 4577]|uniref:hypothetical protein n=1 Tax=Mesorhizobium sp. LCM 4577 TaxID=1848288 RepID=UPI003082D7ED
MHACGQDAHTAMGYAASVLLERQKQSFSGIVRIIFPAGHFKFPRLGSVKLPHLQGRTGSGFVSLTLFPGQGLQRLL